MEISTLTGIIFGVPAVLGIVFYIANPIKVSLKQFLVISAVLIIALIAIVVLVDSESHEKEPEKEIVVTETAAESIIDPLPLSQCEFVDDSNGPGSTVDVCVGNWTDVFGNYYPNSHKFWVIDSPGWVDTEHITYRLGKQYDTLSGYIVAEQGNESNATTIINIYLDEKLAYTSSEVTNSTQPISFSISVSGANQIRIVCSTDTAAEGYCIFYASLT